MECEYCGKAVAWEASCCAHCGTETAGHLYKSAAHGPSESDSSKGRPGIIAAVCVLKGVGAVFSAFLIFSDEAKQVGSWYQPFGTLQLVMTFVWILGVWKMRKWGFYTYVALFFLVQAVFLKMQVWNIGDFVRPAIVLAIFWWYLPKMR